MIKCTTVGVEPSDMCYEMCVVARRCEALKAWEREQNSKRKGANMTIYYKTTKLTTALDYIRIHLSEGYSVSAYKSGVDYIVRVSGVEEIKDEPQERSE